MYLDNIDDRPRWPDDVAAIPSCPFPAKLFPFQTIFSRWTNQDLRQCSAHGSGTSERNSDEVYLIVDSIAIITVRLRFLVMAQRSTRQSTMRREMHEEKCGIQYRSRKARFCGLRARTATPVSKPEPAKLQGPVSKLPGLPKLNFGQVSELERLFRNCPVSKPALVTSVAVILPGFHSRVALC